MANFASNGRPHPSRRKVAAAKRRAGGGVKTMPRLRTLLLGPDRVGFRGLRSIWRQRGCVLPPRHLTNLAPAIYGEEPRFARECVYAKHARVSGYQLITRLAHEVD